MPEEEGGSSSFKSFFDSIKAPADFVNAVVDMITKLNSARSVVLEIDNNTPLDLKRTSDHHDHGGFAIPPHTNIAPESAEVFGSQSPGGSFWTGTEGNVEYAGDGLTLNVYWDNPYFGSTNCNATLSGNYASKYVVNSTCGVGNQAAMMRYELFTTGAWFVSQENVPIYMEPGKAYEVSVTFRNVSRFKWPKGGKVRLGSQAPQDNNTWGLGRVPLPTDVPKGDSVTFNFSVTAPIQENVYEFQWRMVNELVEWFGDYTPIQTIAVGPQGRANRCKQLSDLKQMYTQEIETLKRLGFYSPPIIDHLQELINEIQQLITQLNCAG